MRKISVNLNDRVRFSLTNAGREQYCRSYNKDMPEHYHKSPEQVKSPLEQNLWEMFYFFGSNGFASTLMDKVFENSYFELRVKTGTEIEWVKIPCDTVVEVSWTDNGLVVVSDVEHEMVMSDVRKKEPQEYAKDMKMPLFKFSYYVQNECFNGNTRMPLTQENSITFVLP